MSAAAQGPWERSGERSGSIGGGPGGAPTLRCLQALRGLAACMIVVLHTTQAWSIAVAGHQGYSWWPGAAGVDLFFVLSGLVMAITAVGKGEGPRAAGRFLKRRVIRVVPLYWLCTTVLTLKVLLGFVNTSVPSVPITRGQIIASYLFLPYRNDVTHAQGPVLSPGWSLSYEMFFYACFALALLLRRPVGLFLTGVLGTLAIASMVIPMTGWPVITMLANPLLLEFLAGLWLGLMWKRGRTAPPLVAGAMMLGTIVAGFTLPPASSATMMRLSAGVFGLAMVQAALVFENAVGGRVPRWVLAIGDASYSIYLTHSPLIGGYTYALRRWHLVVAGQTSRWSEARMVAIVLTGSILTGVLTFLVVERPMNEWLRRRFDLRRPVQTAAALESSAGV